MTLQLFLTTSISLILFAIPAYYFQKNQIKSYFSTFIAGGVTWGVVSVAFLILVNTFALIWSDFTLNIFYSQSNMITTVQNRRGVVFWFLFIAVLLNEIVRYMGIKQFVEYNSNYITFIMFGLGWGVSEFITRFLFFPEPSSFSLLSLSFIFIVILNIILSILMIRTDESDKFVLFSCFFKFFNEMGFYGAIGFEESLNKMWGEILGILLISTLILILSLFARSKDE